MSLTCLNPNLVAQISKIVRNLLTPRQIRFKKGLITGQGKTALAGFSIQQLEKHTFSRVDDMSSVTTRLSSHLHLTNRPERHRRCQCNQQDSR